MVLTHLQIGGLLMLLGAENDHQTISLSSLSFKDICQSFQTEVSSSYGILLTYFCQNTPSILQEITQNFSG